MEILLVFLASLMLVASTEAASASSPISKPLVVFEKGRISVEAANVPLKDLLNEIQAKSGIVIELNDSKAAAKSSTVDVKSFLPVLAFREILQNLNFAFFYSGTGLARVLILPRGEQIAKASGLMNPNQIGWRLPRAGNAPLRPGAMPKLPGEKSRDSRVVATLEAIEALEDSDDPKSIATLGEALADQNRAVKEAALQALADKKGANVTQMMRRGLNDADPEFRIEVLEALADRGDLDSVRKALADRNQDVREAAADLLENAS